MTVTVTVTVTVTAAKYRFMAPCQGAWRVCRYPVTVTVTVTVMSSLLKSKSDEEYQTELCIERNKAVHHDLDRVSLGWADCIINTHGFERAARDAV